MPTKQRRAGPNAGRRSKGLAPERSAWNRVSVLGALFAIFLLKLAVMLALKDHILTQPDAGLDTTAYVGLAQRVRAGDVALGPGLYFVSPLYIYFLAVVLGLTDSFTAVRLVQVVLGTCGVGLTYVACREWFGRRSAVLAAILAASTGLLTFYESLLLQAALDPVLTAAAMASLAIALKRGRDTWYALAGLAFGLQTLNRPNMAIAALGIVLLLAATRRWRSAAVLAASIGLALAPVTIRNILVTGDWSAVSSHGGLNFYIGNHAQADGTYVSVPGITPNLEGQQDDARRVAEKAVGHALDEASVSTYFYGLGWAWIREQPAAALKLFVRKLSMVFSSANIWLNYSYPFFKYDAGTPLRALVVGPWILIPLGLVGLVAARPNVMRLEYMIWVSFVPLYAVAVALFFVADRYTLPILIPLCAGAGAALDACARGLSDRRWNQLAIAGAAFVVLFAAVNRPLQTDDGVAEERVRMAERLITLSRYDEAEQWADRAEQGHPRPGLVHFRVGQRLAAHDQMAAAITHFEKALRFDPGRAEVEYVLGATLLDARRPAEASVHLRRARDAGFHANEAGIDLVRALGATGDRVEAVRVLQSLRPDREDDGERWVELGDLGIRLQEPDLAAAFFRNAIAVQPDFVPAYLGLAVTEASRGLLPEAREHVQEALRRDPSSERARQLQHMLK